MTAPSPAGLSPLLDQLDEARAKGTPGEWRVSLDWQWGIEVVGEVIASAELPTDAALIVAEHNAIPQLTAAIRAVAELTQGWRSTTAPLALQLAGDDVHEALTAALTPGADTADTHNHQNGEQ